MVDAPVLDEVENRIVIEPDNLEDPDVLLDIVRTDRQMFYDVHSDIFDFQFKNQDSDVFSTTPDAIESLRQPGANIYTAGAAAGVRHPVEHVEADANNAEEGSVAPAQATRVECAVWLVPPHIRRPDDHRPQLLHGADVVEDAPGEEVHQLQHLSRHDGSMGGDKGERQPAARHDGRGTHPRAATGEP